MGEAEAGEAGEALLLRQGSSIPTIFRHSRGLNLRLVEAEEVVEVAEEVVEEVAEFVSTLVCLRA